MPKFRYVGPSALPVELPAVGAVTDDKVGDDQFSVSGAIGEFDFGFCRHRDHASRRG